MSRESSPADAMALQTAAPGVTPFHAPQTFNRVSGAAEIWELLPVCLECVDLRGFVTYRNQAARIAWSLNGTSDPFVPWLLRWSADSRESLHAAMLQAQLGQRCRVFADRLLGTHTERYQVTLTPQMRSRECRAILAASIRTRPSRPKDFTDTGTGTIGDPFT